MRCEAEKAIERLRENKTLTSSNILEMEIFLRKCSVVCSEFNNALNDKIIKRQREKDAREKPTIQEEDRKAQGHKRWFGLF